MYRNIEKLMMVGFNYKFVVEPVRYGSGFYIAFDADSAIYEPFGVLFSWIGAGDEEAIEHQRYIAKIIENYPDYPIVWAETLEQGLKKVDDKAKKWIENYDFCEREKIVAEIVRGVKEFEKRWN